MKASIFFGYFIMLFIGVAIGEKVSSMAFKPILIAQATEIYQMEEDNKQLQKRFGLLKVEIEAHEQDMEQFIDKSTLMSVLKQLGIVE
jgi:hypothetical protein